MEVERSGGCGRRGSSDRAPGERERQERARSAAGAARRDGNAAEQEVPCTRENVRQLLVTKQDLKALVAVERLLAGGRPPLALGSVHRSGEV